MAPSPASPWDHAKILSHGQGKFRHPKPILLGSQRLFAIACTLGCSFAFMPMKLHNIDVVIIVGYFFTVILVGLWVSRRGAKDLDSYFLGSKSLPWYLLGVSDASGMFDISGTMWLVYILFVYGLKSVWLPFLWPVFNQIFLMMFLSGWLRRSNVLTGAEWIQTRFGRNTGANLAHLSVVLFALVNVVGMLAYAFKGIGKFAVVMLPWHITGHSQGLFSDENLYAVILLGLTSLYAIKGGMVSVVITEVAQFAILTLTSLTIGIIAMVKSLTRNGSARGTRGLDEPIFRLPTRAKLDGISRQGQRCDCPRWQRILFNHLWIDDVQGRLGQSRRAGSKLRHAKDFGDTQPSRSLHDERHGQCGAVFPPVLDDYRHYHFGLRFLHARVASHGQA